MKRNSYRNIFLILPVLFALLINQAYPQGTDSRNKPQEMGKMYAGIIIGFSGTNLKIEESPSTSPLSIDKGSSMDFALGAGYYFSGLLGINIGLGINSYKSSLSLNSYTDNFETIDSENESYEMRISGSSISEDQKISFLSIPVCVNLRYQVAEKISIYVNAGPSLNIPLSKSYNEQGTFSYDGYYPAYPVLLENLPDFGFASDLNTNVSGDLELKSMCIGVTASGGAFYAINQVIQVGLGVYFTTIPNISAYEPSSDFKLTSQANELNSLMAGSSKAGVQSFGVNLGLRYFFK
jgi:hypothetical protein